ncbi:peptidase [Halobacillus sp. Marseille-Q1614]|uniref:peptidase n=1 Tax=Halobacillus sp. Marseille-Q1614 TaxID=2709134 RepID=UPI00156DAAEA|nr:peptidase [Halobacillus sp. Marseille-Q1614]
MSYIQKVSSYIEKNRSEYERLLQEMVQQPSKAGGESGIQDIVEKRLSEKGFDVDRWELDYEALSKHTYFCASRPDFTGSENVVGVLKGEGEGKSLILNGHVDVVPEGERVQWEHDPYSGAIRGNKLFGRGATDMKGGNLSALLAVEAIQALGIKLKGDIIFQSVVEEESGGSGTLAAIERGYTADAALIPEPTNMTIFPKQQGSMWFKVHIYGKSAHGGTRYEGVSAIQKVHTVHEAILQLEQERNERLDSPLYEGNPIPVPINVGKIAGGTWPSSVPDQVTIEGRMGVIPGEDLLEAKAALEAKLAALAKEDSWFAEAPVEVEWFGARWLPGEIEDDHPFLHSLIQAYHSYKNEDPVLKASPWGTDGGLLTALRGIPAVVFGPGETSMAHYPNEFINLDHVFEAAVIMAETILQWCEVASVNESVH